MSELKTNKISTNDQNNVAIDNALGLKSYDTTAMNALTSVAGDMIYNTTENKVFFYNGSAWGQTGSDAVLKIEYLVIAGGGGGAGSYGGAGGAGGYRNSFSTEASGGGNTDGEMPVIGDTGVNYAVSIGGGGSGGGAGGQGGGAGSATTNQGFAGSARNASSYSGSGGGAGGVGTTQSSNGGGLPLSSSITGSAVSRAGGGAGTGSSDQGGRGSVNLGGGGNAGTAGDSGVVILRYPSDFTLTTSMTTSSKNAVVGDDKYTVITAGTGTISFS
tara:strand:- start:498 stop:1316 length:819 start_codon:yes stop_codon:yes gene_type:complete